MLDLRQGHEALLIRGDERYAIVDSDVPPETGARAALVRGGRQIGYLMRMRVPNSGGGRVGIVAPGWKVLRSDAPRTAEARAVRYAEDHARRRATQGKGGQSC